MYVSTSDKAVLKVLWDKVARNGRSPQVSILELAEQIITVQSAGVIVYPFSAVEDVAEALIEDARLLEGWGLLRLNDAHAELTWAGELLAGSLDYPDWAKAALHPA